MDRSTFQTHLTLLSLSARHTGDSSPAAIDALLGLWWRKFGALPDGVLLPAFDLALDTCKFFPSIAEFNDLIRAVAQSEGAIVDGATAWNACEKALFACWSETRDRLILAKGDGYPWPDDRCKEVLRGAMQRTVRDVANMHPKEYAETRDRFEEIYDSGRQVDTAKNGLVVALDSVRSNGRKLASGRQNGYNSSNEIDCPGGAGNTPRRDTEGVSDRA